MSHQLRQLWGTTISVPRVNVWPSTATWGWFDQHSPRCVMIFQFKIQKFPRKSQMFHDFHRKHPDFLDCSWFFMLKSQKIPDCKGGFLKSWISQRVSTHGQPVSPEGTTLEVFLGINDSWRAHPVQTELTWLELVLNWLISWYIYIYI